MQIFAGIERVKLRLARAYSEMSAPVICYKPLLALDGVENCAGALDSVSSLDLNVASGCAVSALEAAS